MAEKIDSVEGLKTFCVQKKLATFDDKDKDYSDNMNRKLREYDEDYFEKKSIVIVFRFKDGEDYYEFKSVEVIDDTLIVNVKQSNCMAIVCNNTKAYIIEMSKQVAENINNININEIPEEVSVKIYGIGRPSAKESNYSTIINSSEDLVNFCDFENDKSDFLKNSQDKLDIYANTRLINLLNEYDKTFFKNKSLVFIYKTKPYPEYYNYDSMIKDGETLKITLSLPPYDGSYGYPCVVAYYVYLIAVDKEVADGVNQVVVEEVRK